MSPSMNAELLHSACEGDKSAAERLISENSGLIWSVARRFFGRGVDSDDLYQLGCLGFIKALKSYDESYGTQFSTYAVPKMYGEIRRFLRDDGCVKVSRGIKERAILVYAARQKLEQANGAEPRLSELAAETGMSPEDIAFVDGAVNAACSLDQETGENGFSLQSVLCDVTQEERMLEYVSLREGIDKLPEKERSVILLRFYKGFTQQNAAKVLGVSQVQVSRIEKRAIAYLREYLED